jgi:hypothetical protein
MANGVLQLVGAAIDAAEQLFLGEACEPAFHQVQPRGTGRCEAQMEAQMTQHPTLDSRIFLSGVIVNDQIAASRRGIWLVNLLQELGTPPPDGGDESARSRWPALKLSAANRLVVP